MKRFLSMCVPVIAIAFVLSQSVAVGQALKYNPDTGHYYAFVEQPITWLDAYNTTTTGWLNDSGYLATVGSSQENNFIADMLTGRAVSAFIGAHQVPGSPEPASGWGWVTGEPWSYTNWRGDAPNDNRVYGNENAVHLYATDSWCPGYWNDLADTYPVELPGFVVEIEPTTTQKVFLNFDEEVPFRVVEKKNHWYEYGKDGIYYTFDSTDTMAAMYHGKGFESWSTNIQSRVEAIFQVSGIPITFVDESTDATVVYFGDPSERPDSFNYHGLASVDRFNFNGNEDRAVVFLSDGEHLDAWSEQSYQGAAETIAHELGHTFGLRHVYLDDLPPGHSNKKTAYTALFYKGV